MSKRGGATIGSAKAPMISEAGKDHVIFSKKLLFIIGFILVTTGVLFFSIEQSRIASSWAKSRQAMHENTLLKNANDELLKAKSDLQESEDELVELYSKWLDEDTNELELSQEQLSELKQQLKEIQDKVSTHSDNLKAKEDTLQQKEKRLAAYQFKIQQKQSMLDQMAAIITKLGGDVPKGVALGEDISEEDLVWDDEVQGDGDDFYDDYYTGDDDWMNDGAW